MHNDITRGTRAVLVAIALTLAGCGGGGGGGGETSGTPPGNAPLDTTAPDTTITSTPAALSNSRSAIFNATSSEAGSTFEVNLDSAGFASATLPLQLSNLTDGDHTMSIRARDAAGNIDATPATFAWSVDTRAPSARIVFPLPNSYTDASVLTIRGTAAESHAIASIHVNDVAATSADGFKTWSAKVPIHAGQNQIVVSTTDELGNASADAASAAVLNRGPVVGSFAGIAIDPSTKQILAADSSTTTLYLFDLVAGSGKKLASRNPASLTSIDAITVDSANHRALIVDGRQALVAVDLSTGATQDLSPYDSSHYIGGATSIVLDSDNDRVFVGSLNAVTEINLTSGVRRTVSGSLAAIGSGPTLNSSPSLALDTFSNPAVPRLVGSVVFDLNANSASIISVDIDTGDRQVIVPADSVSAALVRPTAVGIDASSHRLLVLDSEAKTLVAVDLATGNRTVISDGFEVSASNFPASRGLAVSATTAFVAQEHGEVVEVDLSTGSKDLVLHSRVGSGPQMGPLYAASLEPSDSAPQSLLVVEGGRLARVRLSSGERTIISSATVGSGPFTTGLTAMAPDTRPSSRNAVLGILAQSSELVSIDLDTGDRTHVADLGLSGGTNYQPDMRLDADANRVYFSNVDTQGIQPAGLYSYDLLTNQRSTVADDQVGSGPLPRNAANLLLDKQGNRLIVSDWINGGVISVDLQTGARKELIDDASASLQPGPLYLDAVHSRLLGVGVGGTNIRYQTDSLAAQTAIAALNARGFVVNESSVFTMMAMIEHPDAFFLQGGSTWIGGAQNYSGTRAQHVAFATRYPPADHEDFASRHLFSLTMPEGRPHEIISGPARGTGPSDVFAPGMDVDPVAGIAFLPLRYGSAVMAVDLVSGDRILISH
jgi:Glucodextranase, domain B